MPRHPGHLRRRGAGPARLAGVRDQGARRGHRRPSRAEIEEVIEDLPTVTLKDPEGYAEEQKEQINQFLTFIYGLLGLSVIIAILGVVNTLSLSVIERTREVGLLRAVGVSRRQLRTMIRLESVVIAVFGALLGVVMGVAFGSAVVRALQDDGLTDLAIPWVALVVFVVGGGRARGAGGGLPGPPGCPARRTSCHYDRVGRGVGHGRGLSESYPRRSRQVYSEATD